MSIETPIPAGGLLRRNPGFARLYLAAIVSFGGDWFAVVALQGLVLEKTGRPLLAGLLLATSTLPFAIMSPFAGVIADRVDRRRLMIGADLARAGIALGFLLVRGESTIWIAFVCTALLSAFAPFFEPASSAALPNLVRIQDLARANVLMGSAWGTMLAVGAALGGLVAATLGREAAFLMDSSSFVISALLLRSVRQPFQEKIPEPSHVTILQDIGIAIAFVRREARVRAVLTAKALFGSAGGTIALLSTMAVQVFGRGDTGIGILMGARGVGAFAGPFLFRRFVLRNRDDRLLVSIGAAFTLFSICYALFAGAPNIWLAALAVCGAHIGGGANWTISAYALQRFTPDDVRGRIFAFDYALITMTMTTSLALAGFAAGRFNVRAVAFGFAMVGVTATVAWTVWAWRLIGPRALRRAREATAT